MKKTLAIILALCLCLTVFSALAETTTVTASKAWKIALITMDSIDQHWVNLNIGAQAEAEKLGVTVTFMSPNTKDDAQQIECVNNAVAGGYDAIMVAANGRGRHLLLAGGSQGRRRQGRLRGLPRERSRRGHLLHR
jgi:ABC-type sugar transport system substrate-binding protein